MRLSKIAIKDLANGTNILDIEVPAELERTVMTGVSFLDDAVGGDGFTPSSCMLFTGTPGAGKTTLMLQMADAITGSGNICLFNTAEESPFQVRKVTKRLKSKHGFYIGQDTLVKKILAHARALQKKNPKKQLFIVCDSLQTLDDGKYAHGAINSMTAVRATTMLADFCKETFAVCIIIGQVNKDGQFAGKQMVKHAVDIHAHISIDEAKKSETLGLRLLEVTKNRFGCNGRTYACDMRATGLVEVGSFIKSQRAAAEE